MIFIHIEPVYSLQDTLSPTISPIDNVIDHEQTIRLPLLIENALDMLLKDTDLTSWKIKSELDFTQITVRLRNMAATQVSRYENVSPSQIVRDKVRATKWRDTARDRTVEMIQLGSVFDKEALGGPCDKNEIPQPTENEQ